MKVHRNVSKIKVALARDMPGTAHQFELRKEGLVVSFLPGRGNHRHVPPPVTVGFEALGTLRVREVDPHRIGTPAEECTATIEDLYFLRTQLQAGLTSASVLAAVREQVRRMERILSRL